MLFRSGDFIRLVTAEQPEAPAYFVYDAILNTQRRPTLEENLPRALRPISLDEVLKLGDAGYYPLDVREPDEFAGGHLAGSINIPLGGKYATWAGTILDTKKPIVIIATPGREEEAAMRLGRIGFDNVAGCLDGGMKAVDARPDLVWQTERVTPAKLAELLASPQPPAILDVRAVNEWQDKHIDGVLNIPLNQLQKRIAEVPRDRRLAVHCAGGYRSSIAVSILHQHGITDVIELIGGIGAWEAARLPVVS